VRSAPIASTQSATKVFLYSSNPFLSILEFKDRFEMFGTAAHLSLDCQLIPDSSDELSRARMLAEKAGKSIVLWDLAAHMPPMMIEKLITGLRSNECRVGVRFDGASIVRNCASRRQVWGRLIAAIRRSFGMISDLRPPCLAVGGAVVGELQVLLSRPPSVEWSRIVLKTAAQKNYKITEVPVMWSVR
jgi:hypothetical protein